MRPRQTVTWTALPAGCREGRAWLSVYVAPRLTPGECRTLGQFPAFRRWTETVAAITEYRVHVGPDRWVPGVRVGRTLQSDVWDQLVTDDTPVRPFQPPAYQVSPAYAGNNRQHRIKADLALRRATGAVAPVEPDFHQLWSELGEHAALERVLGMVIDIQFSPPLDARSPATVWVEPIWDPRLPDSTDELLPTRMILHSTRSIAYAL